MASNNEQELIEAASEYPAQNCRHEMVMVCKECGHTRFDSALSVVHRIERAFADRVKARMQSPQCVLIDVEDVCEAMDAELKEGVKG